MMAHFAVLCPEASGHLNPMTTLLAELRRRGHEITWIGSLDGAQRVSQRGLNSVAIGQRSFPLGTLDRTLAEIGKLSGLAATRLTLDSYRQGMELLLNEAPQAIRDCGATALIADETIFASRTIAELVNLPWVTVCNALPFHPDPDLPPMGAAWKYRSDWWGRLRNKLGRIVGQLFLRSIFRVIMEARKRHRLAAYNLVHENASDLATIAQLPAEFDYPRRNQPEWFHYVGALHDARGRPRVEFPFDRLDGRPLIYASLGTVQNRLLPVFRMIADACQDLPVQLVIALGGGGQPEDLGQLPGDPIVVSFAPQLELLQRAQLVITHAGMNTTIESIAHGVPLVAIPITNDQPAVAARIAWSGCGEVVPLRRVTAARLAEAVRRVLGHVRYRRQTARVAEANRRSGGVKAAADIVERVVPNTAAGTG
jgi:zeaxanthin glucosyltransferase